MLHRVRTAPIVSQVCNSEVFQNGNFRRNTPQTTALQVEYARSLGSSYLWNRRTSQWPANVCTRVLSRNLSNDNVAIVHILQRKHFPRLLQALREVTLPICSCFHHCSKTIGLFKAQVSETAIQDGSGKRKFSLSKGALLSSRYLLEYFLFQHRKPSRVGCQITSRCSKLPDAQFPVGKNKQSNTDFYIGLQLN